MRIYGEKTSPNKSIANSEFNQPTYGNPTTFISNFVWENHDFWFVNMRILLGIWEYVEDGRV